MFDGCFGTFGCAADGKAHGNGYSGRTMTDLRTLTFTDADGAPVSVADWLHGGEALLLVFLRHLG